MLIYCKLINPNQYSMILREGSASAFTTLMRSLQAEYSHQVKTYVMEIELLDYLLKHRSEELKITLDDSVTDRLRAIKLERAHWSFLGREKTKDFPIKPFAHQEEDIGRMLADKPAFLNFNPLGLGKTYEALAVLDPNDAVIVVATANTTGVWKNQHRKMGLPHKVEILKGRKSFRWPEFGEMLITTYDLLPNIDLMRSLGNAPKLVIIFDEAHKLKNVTSRRNQAADELLNGTPKVSGIYKSGGKAIFLTGTPLENSPEELFQLLRLSRVLGETFISRSAFLQAFSATNGPDGRIIWGSPSLSAVAKLKRYCIRHDKEKTIDLPDRMYSNITLECDTEVNKAFKVLERQLVELGINLEQALELAYSSEVDENHAIITCLKLLAAAKMPAVLEKVEEYEEAGEPLIVASVHRAGIEILEKREGWAAIHGEVPSETRTAIVDAFQRGKYKGLAVTITAAGEGLTLTHASTMLFIDRHYNPAKNHQCEGRIYRIGAKKTCHYINLHWDHTLEQQRKAIIRRKERMSHETINALTEIPEVVIPKDPILDYWMGQSRRLSSFNTMEADLKKVLRSASNFYDTHGTLSNSELQIVKDVLISNYLPYLEGFSIL